MGKRSRVVQTKTHVERKPYVFPWRQYLPITAILLITAAVYGQVAGFKFMPADDPIYVTLNGNVRQGLNAQSIIWAFTTRAASNWHPLTWMSHMLDCQRYGLIPQGHHVTSLLFHLANTLLLFVVLKRATGKVWRSAFVAGLFALHPLHVESVAWVAERKDVLSTFFWMLTMLAYVYYAEKPRIGRYLLVAAALALGLMAKPMLVTLPIVLLLLDYWPLKRTDGWKRLIVEKLPLFTLSAASCAITYTAQHYGGAVKDMSTYPLTVRAANAVFSYGEYLLKTIAPTDLGPLYPHPGATLPMWAVIASGVLLAGLTLASLTLARKAPYAAVGWLFYVITLIPVIQLVQVGQQGSADRYTYVPLIGIFIAIAWLLPELLDDKLRRHSSVGIVMGALGAIVLVSLAAMTYVQAGTWRNKDTYVAQMIKATHGHPLSRLLQARLLIGSGKLDEADRQMASVARDYPKLPEAHDARAYTLRMLGRPEEAAAELREAIRLRRGYAEAYSNLGALYVTWGKPGEALQWSKKAVEIDPNNAQWRSNLAQTLTALNRMEEAKAEYERAISIQPDLAEPQRDLGALLYQEKDLNGAIEHMKIAVADNPDDAMSRFVLGYTLQQAGYNSEAITHLSAAVNLRPTWGQAHAGLAVALNAAGLTQQAQEEAQLAKKYGAVFGPSPAK